MCDNKVTMCADMCISPFASKFKLQSIVAAPSFVLWPNRAHGNTGGFSLKDEIIKRPSSDGLTKGQTAGRTNAGETLGLVE